MVFELFRWWYGAGFKQALESPKDWTKSVSRSFSTPILLKTLFSPWRRITTISGRSFDAKIMASVDNFVSRLVGFISRFLVLIAAAILFCLSALVGVLIIIVWPLVPVLILFCLVKAAI